VMPPVAAVWLAVGNDGVDATRRWLVVGCVVAWGVRLTANWARSWSGLDHEDWRYVDMFRSGRLPRWLVSLLAVHLFPTIIVALACLPLVAALTNVGQPFGPLDIAAAVVTLGSVALELVADNQLHRFNRTKAVGATLETGLWARSRHPNYLGEMGFWWGLWLFALAGSLDAVWTVIGPIEITVMFVAVSIPLIERRSAARRLDWFGYAERTPVLLPRLRPTGSRTARYR
jgi:steroid 5-alpha reductase family enzyme